MAYHPKSPSVRFKCPHCECMVHEFIENIPAYDPTADSQADANGFETEAVMCQQCGKNTDVEITASGFGLSAELDQSNNSVEVLDDPIHQPSDEDEYEHYYNHVLPQHPELIYSEAVSDARALQERVAKVYLSDNAFWRMMFVQYFGIIEAYLSDRLIRLIMEDSAALVSLINYNKDWADAKLPVTTLVAEPNALQNWVRKELRELMYHNFVKIDYHYKGALGSSIFPNDDTKKTLMRFVPIRHDCVHRNGRDHDNKSRAVGREDVQTLAAAIEKVVLHIEKALSRRRNPNHAKFEWTPGDGETD